MIRNNIFNPTPITKIIVTCILSFTIVHNFNDYFYFSIVGLISILFILNNFIKTGFSGFIFFLLLSRLPHFSYITKNLPPILQIFVGIFIVIKLFYLPVYAGKFFLKTSDVSSIMASMNRCKIPNYFSIPIAVMFRFFPTFKEERKNIKLAMKIRGITIKRPIFYLETVIVPLLILSSNISDDIAKAAETKCIENPIKKTPYIDLKFQIVDFIYLILVIVILLGGIYVKN